MSRERRLLLATEFYARRENWLPKTPGEPCTDLVSNGGSHGWLIAELALKPIKRRVFPRVRTSGWVNGKHLTIGCQFVLDTRSHDIPRTIVGMIRALPKNCIAISLRVQGGPMMVKCAESAARRKNIRILWL